MHHMFPPVWPKYPNALLFHRLCLSHEARFSLHFLALSPILILHGRRLSRGESGMDWKKLLGSITASVVVSLGCCREAMEARRPQARYVAAAGVWERCPPPAPRRLRNP
jgi:hypothetical protein